MTLVESGDYECPYCAEAFDAVQGVLARYGDDVQFVFRNFPLQQLHPLALPAAEVAESVGLLGDFWPMHEWLYENQRRWVRSGPDALLSAVQAVDIDRADVQQALRNPEVTTRIEADVEGGLASGVHGTPAFFVNGWLHEGGNNAASLSKAIEAALAAPR